MSRHYRSIIRDCQEQFDVETEIAANIGDEEKARGCAQQSELLYKLELIWNLVEIICIEKNTSKDNKVCLSIVIVMAFSHSQLELCFLNCCNGYPCISPGPTRKHEKFYPRTWIDPNQTQSFGTVWRCSFYKEELTRYIYTSHVYCDLSRVFSGAPNLRIIVCRPRSCSAFTRDIPQKAPLSLWRS